MNRILVTLLSVPVALVLVWGRVSRADLPPSIYFLNDTVGPGLAPPNGSPPWGPFVNPITINPVSSELTFQEYLGLMDPFGPNTKWQKTVTVLLMGNNLQGLVHNGASYQG